MHHSLSLLLSLLVFLALTTESVHGLNNGLALKPPMGWSSWNQLACNISEKAIQEIADLLVSTGLRDLGYVYLNIDDCWASGRDQQGNLIANPKLFPSGMGALGSYIHDRGLRFGIYTSSGPLTCMGLVGSWGYEPRDAKLFASWEVDFLKVDCCNTTKEMAAVAYPKWTEALNATGRPIVFSCDTDELFFPFPIGTVENDQRPWVWAPSKCNMWRTWGDMKPNWVHVVDNAEFNTRGWDGTLLAPIAGPGQWNDPDMLEVGVGMSVREERSHFSVWAIMAAPLILGNDLRIMNSDTLKIISNKEMIEVNQDPMGIQGKRIKFGIYSDVYAKPLSDKSVAVLFFHKFPLGFAESLTVEWSEIGFQPSQKGKVRDLWQHQDLGVFQGQFEAKSILPGDVVAVRIFPVSA